METIDLKFSLGCLDGQMRDLPICLIFPTIAPIQKSVAGDQMNSYL